MLTYDELIPLFQDAQALPKLPTSALEILEALQSEHTTAQDLETIIMRDPALMTGLLRVANSAMYGGLGNVSTVPAAVLRLGMTSVRSLALSMAVTSVTKSSSGNFDAKAFARHSIYVSFLARYLFARRHVVEIFRTGWTGEEVFAASYLHDLPVALLSKLHGETYNTVLYMAREDAICFRTAFQKHYGTSIGNLGVLAATAWNLPSVFVDVISFLDHPLEHQSEPVAMSCIALANELANHHGWGFEKWPVPSEKTENLIETVGLSTEDIEAGLEMVDRHTNAFLGTGRAA